MFIPKAIYFEKDIENYTLGKELLEKYKAVPKIEIQSHNAIEEMRHKENKEFVNENHIYYVDCNSVASSTRGTYHRIGCPKLER